MADDLSGQIDLSVIMSEGEGSGGGGTDSGGIGTGSGDDAKKSAKKQTGLLGKIGGVASKILPMMGFVTLAVKAVMGSVIFSSSFKVLVDILSAVIDLLLMPLIPLLVPLIQALMPLLPAIQAMAETASGPLADFLGLAISVLIPFIEFISGIIVAMHSVFHRVFDFLLGKLGPIVEYAVSWWENVLGGVLSKIQIAMSAVGDWLISIAEVALGVIGDTLSWIWDKLVSIYDFWKDTIGKTIETMGENIKKAYDFMKELPGKIADKLKEAIGGITNIGGKATEVAGGVVSKLNPLTWFAGGTNYVPKTSVYGLEKGEKVLTASESSSGGINIVNNINVEASSPMGLEDIATYIGDSIDLAMARKIRSGVNS